MKYGILASRQSVSSVLPLLCLLFVGAQSHATDFRCEARLDGHPAEIPAKSKEEVLSLGEAHRNSVGLMDILLLPMDDRRWLRDETQNPHFKMTILAHSLAARMLEEAAGSPQALWGIYWNQTRLADGTVLSPRMRLLLGALDVRARNPELSYGDIEGITSDPHWVPAEREAILSVLASQESPDPSSQHVTAFLVAKELAKGNPKILNRLAKEGRLTQALQGAHDILKKCVELLLSPQPEEGEYSLVAPAHEAVSLLERYGTNAEELRELDVRISDHLRSSPEAYFTSSQSLLSIKDLIVRAWGQVVQRRGG